MKNFKPYSTIWYHNENPNFLLFLCLGAGIFLGALHHIFLFAVGSQSCFLLFPAELFPLVWGILAGSKGFFTKRKNANFRKYRKKRAKQNLCKSCEPIIQFVLYKFVPYKFVVL